MNSAMLNKKYVVDGILYEFKMGQTMHIYMTNQVWHKHVTSHIYVYNILDKI